MEGFEMKKETINNFIELNRDIDNCLIEIKSLKERCMDIITSPSFPLLSEILKIK